MSKKIQELLHSSTPVNILTFKVYAFFSYIHMTYTTYFYQIIFCVNIIFSLIFCFNILYFVTSILSILQTGFAPA